MDNVDPRYLNQEPTSLTENTIEKAFYPPYVQRNIALDLVGSEVTTKIKIDDSPICEEERNYCLPQRR